MKTAAIVEQVVDNIPYLEQGGRTVARSIHKAVLEGGDATRMLADLLHGTWLGHPLHSVLTDIPVGAWSAAGLFDLIALAGNEEAERTADLMVTLGVLSALPTSLAGLADYSTAPKPAVRTATLHALLMNTVVALYAASLWKRRNGARGAAILLSMLGFSLLLAGAYLGGHLVYKQKVGVDHSEAGSRPREWTAVLDAAELGENEAKRVEVEGDPILLYRYGGTVHAIDAVCSHAGGPLEEGSFDGYCVQCPWHDSVFDTRDGSIVHGPATYPQPNYAARIREGKIEVRVA